MTIQNPKIAQMYYFHHYKDDNDEVVTLPPPSKRHLKARSSVSAEAYGTWNKKEDFKARVIPKTEEKMLRIKEKLKTSFIFSAVEGEDLDIVINAMEEKKYKKDDVVIQQGDEGNELYVVDSGTLSCSRKFVSSIIKQGPNEQPRFLKNYQPGEAFGELALLYNSPRAATIIANEDCVLWSLDRPTFSNIVKDAAM